MGARWKDGENGHGSENASTQHVLPWSASSQALGRVGEEDWEKEAGRRGEAPENSGRSSNRTAFLAGVAAGYAINVYMAPNTTDDFFMVHASVHALLGASPDRYALNHCTECSMQWLVACNSALLARVIHGHSCLYPSQCFTTRNRAVGSSDTTRSHDAEVTLSSLPLRRPLCRCPPVPRSCIVPAMRDVVPCMQAVQHGVNYLGYVKHSRLFGDNTRHVFLLDDSGTVVPATGTAFDPAHPSTSELYR